MVQPATPGNLRSASDPRDKSAPPPPVKLEFEDPLEDEHGPLDKRRCISAPLHQNWGGGASMGPPVVPYNLLDEPSPLGLRLRKSPSLLDLIQMRLSRPDAAAAASGTVTSESIEKKEIKSTAVSGSATDKMKASNFPVSLLKIGTWERVSRYEGDLVAKCYFAKHKLVWEVLEGGLKSKIEIQWSDITALKATYLENGPGSLDIVLVRQPLFFRETNPQPRKHTLWQATSDFTGGQASIQRQARDVVRGIKNVLGIKIRRTWSAEVIRELKSLGIKTAMLTGDSTAAAMQAQKQLGNSIEMIHAELLPEDKVRIVSDLKTTVGPTVMVGDGLNDAPALAMANVGFSMGISGSAVAMETSHVTLMSNDIRKIAKAILLARRTYRKIIVNMLFSVVTKLAILALAIAGHPLLWAAVLADVGTCLLVILNSMTLLRTRAAKEKCAHSSHKSHSHCCDSSHESHTHKHGGEAHCAGGTCRSAGACGESNSAIGSLEHSCHEHKKAEKELCPEVVSVVNHDGCKVASRCESEGACCASKISSGLHGTSSHDHHEIAEEGSACKHTCHDHGAAGKGNGHHKDDSHHEHLISITKEVEDHSDVASNCKRDKCASSHVSGCASGCKKEDHHASKLNHSHCHQEVAKHMMEVHGKDVPEEHVECYHEPDALDDDHSHSHATNTVCLIEREQVCGFNGCGMRYRKNCDKHYRCCPGGMLQLPEIIIGE